MPPSSSEDELISLASSDEDGDSGEEEAAADGEDYVGANESGSEEGAEEAEAAGVAEAETWERGSQASTAIEDATDCEDFTAEYGEPTHAPVALAGQQGTFWVWPIYCATVRY